MYEEITVKGVRMVDIPDDEFVLLTGKASGCANCALASLVGIDGPCAYTLIKHGSKPILLGCADRKPNYTWLKVGEIKDESQ